VDDTTDEDVAQLDELATRRARQRIEHIFSEHKIPGRLDGDLYCFGFADLVARVEIVKGSHSNAVHAHLTVSGPVLAKPVLDCWMGMGTGPAEALDEALSQWSTGPYLAYHDAFAHDHPPTHVIEHATGSLHVFEAPLQGYAPPEAISEIEGLGITRALVERAELAPASDHHAHRLRWVRGIGGTAEVFVDDEFRPSLTETLNSYPWPEKAMLVRHSAVIVPAKLAAERQPMNRSLGDTHEMLLRAKSVLDVDSAPFVLGAIQHGIERNPQDERIPSLCLRWSQLLAESTGSGHIEMPLDAPLSRGLLEAYARMSSGRIDSVDEWIATSLARASDTDGQLAAHRRAIANLWCEYALPQRTDAVINGARHMAATRDAITAMALSAMEAPSALASLRAVAPHVSVTCSAVGSPDPRLPSSPNAISLWTYRADGLVGRLFGKLGMDARPAVPAPTSRTSDAVMAVARMPYSRERWTLAGREVANGVADVGQLLAVMVHPPTIADLEPWDSRFRVMVAAALSVGHLAGDASSIATNHLVRLIDGPVDWTTTAATIGLCDVALRRSELAPAIVREIKQRLARPLTPVWYQCFVAHAQWLLVRLGATSV